jgi:hypothetical protein
MKILQASPEDFDGAILLAKTLGCLAIAWDLRFDCEVAVAAAKGAGLHSVGWLQAARDPEAAALHPEWLHAPQHWEWVRTAPPAPNNGGASVHPMLVGGWIGLNTKAAFDHALATVTQRVAANPWCQALYLSEIQGPPMGCGCGNPCCRSWDNAPGEKIAPTAYEKPEILFPLAFFKAVRAALPELDIVPILCPECERGIVLDGVNDPDGPEGTNLCQGIPCTRPCALDYWPRLLAAFRAETPIVGLLALTNALQKNHKVYGEEGWALKAHRHYGTDLLACVEPADTHKFTHGLIATSAPQDCWPVVPPEGYVAAIPPIMCGYCPP